MGRETIWGRCGESTKEPRRLCGKDKVDNGREMEKREEKKGRERNTGRCDTRGRRYRLLMEGAKRTRRGNKKERMKREVLGGGDEKQTEGVSSDARGRR